MNIVFPFLLIPIIGVFMYWQNDYNFVVERVEVINFNKNFFYLVKTHNFKFNRTNFGMNLTFNVKRDLENELKVQIQAYKFASNEYRLFPLRMILDVCDSLSSGDWGMQIFYHCGNFSKCPLKKGNYTVCNWYADQSTFPPYIPGGKYKSDLTFLYKSQEIAFMEAYSEVKPKNSWEM